MNTLPQKFSAAIRNRIEDLCFDLEYLLVNNSESSESHLPIYSVVDEDSELLNQLNKFGANNSELVEKNLSFVNPTQFRAGDLFVASISMQTPLDEFADYFNDFVNATSRVFMTFQYKYQKREYFKNVWEKLNTDFFSDEIEITFRAILFQFWYTGGGGKVEDLIPDENLTIRWQGHDADGELIIQQLEDAIHAERAKLEEYDDRLLHRPYNFMEYRIKVNKATRLEDAFESARQTFEKVTYLIRLLTRGGAHYSCIVGDYHGNKMNSPHVTIYEPLNQQFIPLGTSEISWPDIRAFHNAWELLKLKSIDDFMFQNQKFRDFAQTKILRTSSSYGNHYKLTIRLEQILDFVQIIESCIGEFGTTNAEYLDLIHGKELKDRFETLIRLRNKYVHGLSDELYRILNEKYGHGLDQIEGLDAAIESFAYITKLTVLKSLVNPDIKPVLLEYHLNEGRQAFGQPKRKKIENNYFPTLTSIWH